MLLFRLMRDSRVSATNKVLVGTGIAYFVLPIDILPEAIVGPMGYVDDLILGVFILNRVLTDTDAEIVRLLYRASQAAFGLHTASTGHSHAALAVVVVQDRFCVR